MMAEFIRYIMDFKLVITSHVLTLENNNDQRVMVKIVDNASIRRMLVLVFTLKDLTDH